VSFLKTIVEKWRQLPEAVRFGLGVYIVSRAIYSLWGALVVWAFPLHAAYPQPPINNWFDRYFIAPWYRWDVGWFLRIAEEGYTVVDGRSSFFPLYPFLMRVVGDVFGGNYIISGLVVSNVALIAALILLFQLVERRYGAKIARGTLICLALYPAYFFNMAYYAESLSLLTTVACFYALETRRWPWVGVFAALAVLSKLPSVVLLVPIVWEFWLQRRRIFSTDVLAVLAIPLTLVLWSTTLRLIGNEVAMTDTSSQLGILTPLLTPSWQSEFGGQVVMPWQGIYLAFQSIPAAIDFGSPTGIFKVVYDVVMVFFFACIIPFTLRLRHSTYLIYCVAAFTMNLMVTIPSTPLANFPRRMMMAFPIFIVIAMIVKKPGLRLALFFVAVLLSVTLNTFFIWWRWVG
jgi:hypothetical protein